MMTFTQCGNHLGLGFKINEEEKINQKLFNSLHAKTVGIIRCSISL